MGRHKDYRRSDVDMQTDYRRQRKVYNLDNIKKAAGAMMDGWLRECALMEKHGSQFGSDIYWYGIETAKKWKEREMMNARGWR